MGFGLYTAKYENTEQIFHASTDRDFYNAVAGADRTGMDVADYVYDEVPVKLWRGINQLSGVNHFNGAVHYFNYYTVRYVHSDYFRL